MKNNYSILDKLLHKLIIKKTPLKTLFEIEKFFYNKKLNYKNLNKHIFVTGLARSGTTMILNFLDDTKEFATLRYQDMPFLTSPNLFSFFKRNNFSKFERYHGDNVLINIESPEALDEIFFKFVINKNQTDTRFLLKENLSIIDLEEYNKYIKFVMLKYKKERYLSKNNNNILRLKSLIEYFQNSNFLIIFRDPISHSNSLLKTHLRITELQNKDDFAYDYMNLLGHYEFGKNEKNFLLNHNFEFSSDDKKNINFWLEKWLNYYSEIEKFKKYKNLIFINYEDFISNDKKYIQNILDRLQINHQNIKMYKFFKPKKYEKVHFNEILKNKCDNIYNQLNKIKI